jgi:hypothetical protein
MAAGRRLVRLLVEHGRPPGESQFGATRTTYAKAGRSPKTRNINTIDLSYTQIAERV